MSASRQALEQSFQLAVAHHRAGQLAEAEELYQQILAANPRHADSLHLLALIALNAGRGAEAEGLVRRAVEAAPREAEFQNTLGALCQSAGNLREAEERFRTAIRRRPGYAEAMGNLAALLNLQDRSAEAIEWAQRAVAIKPDYAAAYDHLGSASSKHGRPEEAARAFRAGLALTPDAARLWSKLLFVTHFLPEVAPQELFALHVRVGRTIAEGVSPYRGHSNSREPERRLRIGYLSPHLRMNAISYFMLPILRAHDRSAVEVFCYADVPSPDAATGQAKALADGWRPIDALSDEAAARAVYDDRIDILVDLAGHTAGRLALFARRPAPVQVTYLGYPDTTGLPAMDYRLTDSLADPPGEADARATEKLVRIDPCAWCYAPLGPTPEAVAQRVGSLTFGSFNDLAKLSAPTLAAWAEILRAVPGSRLLVKNFAMSEAAAREHFERRMQALGIEPARLALHGYLVDPRQHLGLYHEIDIALDAFPYNGTTTTCDALWMGVPVVALAGAAHAGRVGASLLNAVGLGELVAADRDAYVRTAVALANDPARRASLRDGLRERMRRSPLTDAPGFCRRLEAAYRQMWHGFCREAPL